MAQHRARQQAPKGASARCFICKREAPHEGVMCGPCARSHKRWGIERDDGTMSSALKWAADRARQTVVPPAKKAPKKAAKKAPPQSDCLGWVCWGCDMPSYAGKDELLAATDPYDVTCINCGAPIEEDQLDSLKEKAR